MEGKNSATNSPVETRSSSASKAYESEIDQQREKIEELDQTIKELNRRISEITIRSVEILGIFVAFFTFVSSEFRIVQSFNSLPSAVSLTLILLGALMLFVLTITTVLRWDLYKLRFWDGLWWLFLIAVLLIGAGLAVTYVDKGRSAKVLQTEAWHVSR